LENRSIFAEVIIKHVNGWLVVSTLRRQQFTMASHRAVYLDRSCTADVPVIAGRHGVGVHSYADGTQLFLHTRSENSAATFTRLQICIHDVGEWMSANRVKLNTGKTQFTCLGTRQQHAKVDATTLSANVSTVDLLCNVTCLGVTIDQELSFGDYVRSLSGQCFYWLRKIRVIRRTLPTDTIKALVNVRVVNRIDYSKPSSPCTRHPPAAVARSL